jgi:hypothetical protein
VATTTANNSFHETNVSTGSSDASSSYQQQPRPYVSAIRKRRTLFDDLGATSIPSTTLHSHDDYSVTRGGDSYASGPTSTTNAANSIFYKPSSYAGSTSYGSKMNDFYTANSSYGDYNNGFASNQSGNLANTTTTVPRPTNISTTTVSNNKNNNLNDSSDLLSNPVITNVSYKQKDSHHHSGFTSLNKSGKLTYIVSFI